MNLKHFSYLLTGALLVACGVGMADSTDYEMLITETYLRQEFVFGENEKLKYAKCKRKRQFKCTYVWGADNKRDATRLERGLAPEGNRLMMIYAAASSQKDFQRVLATYRDAEQISDLGEQAVWSNGRKQLSLITASNLIIHVNIQPAFNSKSISDPKAHAISIADRVLKQL